MSVDAMVARKAILGRIVQLVRALRPVPAQRRLMDLGAMGLSPHLRRDLGLEDVELTARRSSVFNR